MRARRIEKLFERYRDHADGAALAAVFDATAPRLLELACHLVRDPSEAEDLVQSTFLAAIRHAGRFDSSAPLEGWLYGILWREALKAKRRAARRVDPRDVDQPAESDPGEALAAAELPQAVREALEKLPRHERDVLEPFLLEDLRADEIARKLQRSAGTVRSQIHRALGRLRRNLPASLTPVAGMIPIRGLDAVRGEVLTAAGFPATTAAAVVSVGVGSRVLLGVAALTVALGGWAGVRIALGPAGHKSNPDSVVLQTEPIGPAALAASPSSSDRAPVLPAGGSGARIALTVVDSSKFNPAPNIPLEVWPGVMQDGEITPHGHAPDQSPIARGRTDNAGQVELVLPAGQPLRIEMPAWGRMFNDLTSDPAPFLGAVLGIDPLEPGERRAVRMQVFYGRQFSVFGRVSAKEDGRPIGRAAVIALDTERENNAESILSCGPESASRRVEADGDGRFELKLTYMQLSASKFGVVADGFGPVLFGQIDAHETPANPLEIKLERSAVLEGRVVADESTLLGGVSIQLSTRSAELVSSADPSGWGFSWPISWRAECARDGSFRFSQLPPRVEFSVELGQQNRAMKTTSTETLAPLRLQPGQTRQVEWGFQRGARVTGLALDRDFDPAPNREIWLLKRPPIAALFSGKSIGSLRRDDQEAQVARTTTDAMGRFTLDGVQPGIWWVGIAPDPLDQQPGGEKVIALAVQFELPQGVPTVDVVIKPRNTLPIRGRVIGPDGAPVWNASIRMARPDGELEHGPDCGWTAQDGTFVVLPEEEGEWKLCARGGSLVESDPVVSRSGQDGVILKLKPGATISGQAVCPECRADQQLQFELLGDRLALMQPWSFGGGQEFTFDGLPAGNYEVFATCEPDRAGITRGIKLSAGSTAQGVRIELAVGAVLTVRYIGKGESCDFEHWLGSSYAGWKSVSKITPLRIIALPGLVRLRPSGGSDRTYTIRAGSETEVVLDDN